MVIYLRNYTKRETKKHFVSSFALLFLFKTNGKGVVQAEEPVEKGWQYPHPNSAQSLILKSVCNKSN